MTVMASAPRKAPAETAAIAHGGPGSSTVLSDLTEYFNPNHLWGALTLGVIFLLFGFVASWLLRRSLKTLIEHDPNERIDRMTIGFIQHLATFIMWIVLALLFSHLIPALNKLTTSLLAGVSIVSVVIGFASGSRSALTRRGSTSCVHTRMSFYARDTKTQEYAPSPS